MGASVAKVCEHCRTTVYRTDRGLEDLGKVAALANVPALISTGDEGTLGGRHFEVKGRVQLDHGAGPWEEYYVAYDGGASWGFLAYAEGNWYATAHAETQGGLPAHDALRVERDVEIPGVGSFRIAEVKTARVVSAEGELPERTPPGAVRRYADLHGANDAFATLDYGDGTGPVELFVGRRFEERDMQVTAVGPRSAEKVKLAGIRCPNCGGDVPKLSGERAERIGCPYCGAVSDIAAQRVIARQDEARAEPPIPLGSRGTLAGVQYVAIAYVRRSAEFEGERFSWEELLLFSEGHGFRWLVKDETTWLFVEPVNLAELDLRELPRAVGHRGQRFTLRNRSDARVDYVLGEVYWKCELGETVRAADYVRGRSVLSREESPGEVRWSRSEAIAWPIIAAAFGVSGGGPPAEFGSGGGGGGTPFRSLLVLLVILVIVIAIVSALDGGGGSYGGGVYGGSGYYYGGK